MTPLHHITAPRRPNAFSRLPVAGFTQRFDRVIKPGNVENSCLWAVPEWGESRQQSVCAKKILNERNGLAAGPKAQCFVVGAFGHPDFVSAVFINSKIDHTIALQIGKVTGCVDVKRRRVFFAPQQQRRFGFRKSTGQFFIGPDAHKYAGRVVKSGRFNIDVPIARHIRRFDSLGGESRRFVVAGQSIQIVGGCHARDNVIPFGGGCSGGKNYGGGGQWEKFHSSILLTIGLINAPSNGNFNPRQKKTVVGFEGPYQFKRDVVRMMATPAAATCGGHA